MAAKALITRRTALKVTAAGVAATAVATLAAPVAGAVVHPQDIDDQLTELARSFYEAAKLIDPSITGAWFGQDMTLRTRDAAFQSIYFERAHAPFIRRRKPQEA